MRRVCIAGLTAIAFAVCSGCGKDEIVRVDNGTGQDGVIRRDIDKAKEVGAKQSAYQKDGESVAFGDSK